MPRPPARYRPVITSRDDAAGVMLHDQLVNARYPLATPDEVTTSAVERGAIPWPFPVDSAARIPAPTLVTPQAKGVTIRAPDAAPLEAVQADSAQIAGSKPTTLSRDGWIIADLWSTPLKVYVAARDELHVTPTGDGVRLHTPVGDALFIGARSLHERPARTITTPAEPRPLMRAVSEFGSALKELSCERSFPTLRGHPPALKLGDTLSIPDGERAPETGITIEVPESLHAVYTVAPLAYYLGATVEPGPEPRLKSSTGVDYSLTTRGSLAKTVREVLRHTFTLDCIVRTEGNVSAPLAERAALDGLLRNTDETFASLYGQPIAEQVATYLQLPFPPVTQVAPGWRHPGDIPADERGVGVLPYLTADLASIRCYDPANEPAASTDSMEPFQQEGSTAVDEFRDRADDSGSPADGNPVSRDTLFRIRDAPTPVQTYVGDGFPIGANKASRTSYEQQLTAQADASANADVLVVCNDQEMIAETDVEAAYASFELLPVATTVETGLSCAALREAFTRDVDLLHYIGHVDARGVQASDGYLDLGSIESIGATAFILNGCRSFNEGTKLVDAGALGGVVTLERVHNSLATKMGRHIARLVNAGWPLDQAMSLLEADALIGQSYAVVGDGSGALVANAATPTSYTLAPPESGDSQATRPADPASADIDVTIHTHPNRSYNLGTMYQPLVGTKQHYLSGGEIDTFTVPARELDRLFSDVTLPVVVEHERAQTTLSLRWSDDLAGDVERLTELVYETTNDQSQLRGEDVFSLGELTDVSDTTDSTDAFFAEEWSDDRGAYSRRS